MPYIPHTKTDVKTMLDALDCESIEQLFDEIPPALRAGQLQRVPEGLGEMDVMRLMSERAQADSGLKQFIGAGAYEHHVPAAVWEIMTRGEFYTAYTPYQAEASQGTLQLIYEFQSMMASLTGMDVSNASVYDGASGLAEAVLMAVRANRKSKSRAILMPENVHPAYRSCVENIVGNQNVRLISVPVDKKTGLIDQAVLEKFAEEDAAALVISQPNFFGGLDDVNTLTDWAHKNGKLVVAHVNPTSLALLEAPGQWGEKGADIAVGEGQPLGIPLSSGGPYFGFLCCKQAIVRQMPGRIIGRTVDMEGKEGFVLTLQAREQHIRRSKATSNICTNQGLAMGAATIYMSLMGATGLQRVAENSYANTHELIEKVSKLKGVSVRFGASYFHETVIDLPAAAEAVVDNMLEQGILAGYSLAKPLGLKNSLLVCVTETKTSDDIDQYVQALTSALEVLA